MSDIQPAITYHDIIQHKKKQPVQLLEDLKKLKAYDAIGNKLTYVGHKVLYHYQIDNICRVATGKHPALYRAMTNPILKDKLMMEVIKRKGSITPGNVFETNRINRGSVVVFKPSTAMYLYKKYSATTVLDPCAGWGGRLLGAWALGINYIGYDTNIDLQAAYDGILQLLETESQPGKLESIFRSSSSFETGKTSWKINFQSSLEADFSSLDYDFVLTSPPYINLEKYENMILFESGAAYYREFLIPLINKCLLHIQPGGKVCFNISTGMYKKLTEKYGFPVASESIPYKQSTKKQDFIYIWSTA